MCALAAYAVLTAAMTWPLVLQLGAVVPKDLGDPLFSVWALWWNASLRPFSEAWWHGPIFVPQPDALALADHRVGLGLITTPLVWAGASPLAAYGVAFLASFVVSAAAAYALGVALGAGRLAAFAGGLVFGFHPFRAAHLEHVELLSAYWLPLTLVCLHRWQATRSRAALAGVATTLVLLALTSGYYYFYSGVLIAGWVAWFAIRGTSWRERLELAAALAMPLAVLAPVLWRYRAVHAELGLSRTITEIEALSADLTGLVTPPEMLAFWNTAPAGGHPEGALFPGVTAVALVVLAVARRPAAAATEPSPWRARLRRTLAVLAVLIAGLAVVAAITGPLVLRLGPLTASVSALYKPLSLATLCIAAWAALSPRLADRWRRQSPLAFYLLATLAMWVLALGPTARLFGERVLYKAPYAWLMTLPGFADAFRAPARFAMLAALTLAVAAALALGRLTAGLRPRARAAVVAAGVAGIVLDGWIDPLPLPAPPAPLAAIDALPRDTVVLEAPLGTFEDLAAMYRAISHRRPLANGYSGYEPAHYTVLRTALADGQAAVLGVLAPDRNLAVVIASTADGRWLRDAVLSAVPEASASRIDGLDVIAIPRRPVPPAPPARPPLPIVAVAASANPDHAALATDGQLATAWRTVGPQTGGEQVRVDLGGPRRFAGIELRLGRFSFAYPRRLRIETSSDGASWAAIWEGDTAVAALRGALDAPAAVPLRLDVVPVSARYIRLTQAGRSAHPWAIAELAVLDGAGRHAGVRGGSRRSSR